MSGDLKPAGFFPETHEKNILRLRDARLIARLAEKKGRLLTYCGLSGRDARDVDLWREHLDRVIVVERPMRDESEEVNFRSSLLLKLSPIFNGNVHIVFSDIWDYLGSTEFGTLADCPDVFNLDFCGGLLNRVDLNYLRQRASLQKVFSKASTEAADFILLFTLMPRDRGKHTYRQFLRDQVQTFTASLSSSERRQAAAQVEANLRFHERSNLTLFKACLPLLVADVGRSFNFQVSISYIRLYTKMIHLAFACNFVAGVLALAPDPQLLLRILNSPVRRLLADGREQQRVPPQVRV